jgi:hypothetical protein
MPKWVMALIGLAIVLVILVVALEFSGGSGGTVEVSEFKITVNPRPRAQPDPPAPKPPAPTKALAAECRLPEHGVESWSKVQRWTADSGWRKGGSSPAEFCGAQKLAREKQYPDRKVDLLSSAEDHKVERTPFKHDYYRYKCIFEDRWEPVYKLARNDKCPRADAAPHPTTHGRRSGLALLAPPAERDRYAEERSRKP